MSGFNKDLKRGEMFFIQKSSDYIECGSEIYSGRPAIIVSNQNLNAVSKTVEVVYLTTKEKYDSHLHVKIQSIKSSVAICEQITTVAKERIGDYYGMEQQPVFAARLSPTSQSRQQRAASSTVYISKLPVFNPRAMIGFYGGYNGFSEMRKSLCKGINTIL